MGFEKRDQEEMCGFERSNRRMSGNKVLHKRPIERAERGESVSQLIPFNDDQSKSGCLRPENGLLISRCPNKKKILQTEAIVFS